MTGQVAERCGHIYKNDKVIARSVRLGRMIISGPSATAKTGKGADHCGHSYQINKVIADMWGYVRLR